MPDDVKAADAGAGATGSAAASTDAATGGTGEAAPAASAAQSSQTEDYRARFTGLQGKYQQEKQAWQQEKATLLGQVQSSTEQLNGLQATVAQLQQNVEAEKARYSSLHETQTSTEEKLAETVGQVERYKLVLSEFPELASFEAKGLLPKADDIDGLRTAFTDFRTLLSETTAAEMKGKGVGASADNVTATGSRTQAPTAKDLEVKILEANQKGDYNESMRLSKLLIQMQNQADRAQRSAAGG